jgi:putative FmdB family regulatory protein
MPLYDFECKCGHQFEKFGSVKDPDHTSCPHCNERARKIITLGHGAVFDDHPVWIDDEVRGCLQGDNEKPIRTRTHLARYLKENNIEPRA